MIEFRKRLALRPELIAQSAESRFINPECCLVQIPARNLRLDRSVDKVPVFIRQMRIIADWGRRHRCGGDGFGLPRLVQMLLKFILTAASTLLLLSGLERLPNSRIVRIEMSWVHTRLTFMITVGSQLLGQAVSKLTSPPQVSDHSKRTV
ncbi:hypothetical protein GCM10007880_61370 [Mesorhizobium amorphae]|nr:hypothetical protein GCM10007880_61370 [Mesorhizobium amorphae]